MRKLRILAPKKLIKIIKKLGFRLDHKTGSHFIFYDAKTKRRIVTVSFQGFAQRDNYKYFKASRYHQGGAGEIFLISNSITRKLIDCYFLLC